MGTSIFLAELAPLTSCVACGEATIDLGDWVRTDRCPAIYRNSLCHFRKLSYENSASTSVADIFAAARGHFHSSARRFRERYPKRDNEESAVSAMPRDHEDQQKVGNLGRTPLLRFTAVLTASM